MLRPGILIAATLFVVIALAHGLSFLLSGGFAGGSWDLRQWISLMGVVLPLVVAGLLLMEIHGRRHH